MTYLNTFDQNKNYESVRNNYGQKPVSQEVNEAQSLGLDFVRQAFDTLFEDGFILQGLELVTYTDTSYTLSSGYIYINGRPRFFSQQAVTFSGSGTIPVWADLLYTIITKTDDTELVHPAQPDLPVGDRSKYQTSLSATEPTTTPSNFEKRFKILIGTFDTTTKKFTKSVTNASKFLNLNNLPGAIKTEQIGAGQIDPENIEVLLDGLPLRNAIALRIKEANGDFLSQGGAYTYVDNVTSGSPQGVKTRLDPFVSYVEGFRINKPQDEFYFHDHASTTVTRSNESKTAGITWTFVDANVNTGTDVITITGHGFSTGTAVQLSSSGTLPAGLTAFTTYYVRNVSANTITLHSTAAGATANTGLINITAAAGGGTHRIGVMTFSITKTPAATLTALDGDVEVFEQTITKGTGSSDIIVPPQSGAPTVAVSVVRQGGTTYTAGVNYNHVGDTIVWISGAPANGTTYLVTYTYRRAFVVGTDVRLDTARNTITFHSSIFPKVATSFQATYTYYVGRWDSLVVDRNGLVTIVKGIPSDTPQPPTIPEGNFELARIYIPAGSNLGNTFLATNGYNVPDQNDIDYRAIQVYASRMRDHKRRFENIQDLAYNDSVNTALNYFVSKDQSLTKKGVFADGFYDDRLSDYGQPTQNIVINSETGTGVSARDRWRQVFEHNGTAVPTALFHGGNFVTLNYTESNIINQDKWSDTIDLQPFALLDENKRVIVLPNRNLASGQKFRIQGAFWAFGESNIEFFVNGIKLTGITIIRGTAGTTDAVNAASDGGFEVEFTLPSTLPAGYRSVVAQSAVSGNTATTQASINSSGALLGSHRGVLPGVSCGQTRAITGHDARRALRLRPRGGLGEIQKWNCSTLVWDFVSYWDPVAQTFTPAEDMYITSVEVYFTQKDPVSYVWGSLLLTKDGQPEVDYGRLGTTFLSPAQINTNGTATKFTFSNPVYVRGGETYAFFLECPTTGYRVQYARIGRVDRRTYQVTPGQSRVFAQQTNSTMGPWFQAMTNNRRDRDTTHRWVSKEYLFTPTEAIDVGQIKAIVYVGTDADSLRAQAIWELHNVTDNQLVWSYTKSLWDVVGEEQRGLFAVKGFENVFNYHVGGLIETPIKLIANKQYRLRVRADQTAPYKFLRDDFPNDNTLNCEIVGFTESNTSFELIKENVLTTGLMFASPDAEFWEGRADSDLRFKVNRADFTGNTSATVEFKPFNATGSPGVGELMLALNGTPTSITHFTTALNAVTPKGTSVEMEYAFSTNNGSTWSSWIKHTPVVFKELVYDDADDKSTWSFFNFGFFSEQRFREQNIDPQFVPSSPNKSISLGTLVNAIKFRLVMSTTNTKLSPLLDSRSWGVLFEQYKLSTVYFSRTTTLQNNIQTTSGQPAARIYIWANVPSTVTQTVNFTTEGLSGSPTYVQKTSPTATRTIDAANNIVEYEYLYDGADVAAQTDLKNPKVRVNWTTTDRFQQAEIKRIGFNCF